MNPSPSPAGVLGVRSRAGLSLAGPFAVVEIGGADRVPFLQAQLPADVAALGAGDGVYTATLDAKGRVGQDLLLLELGDHGWAILRRELIPAFLERLERYHIREDLTARDRSGELAVLELHGPSTPVILAAAGAAGPAPGVSMEPYRHRELTIAGAAVRFAARPWTGDVGGHLIVLREEAERVREALQAAGRDEGLVEVDAVALETLRLEGGLPRVGVDVDDRTLLPELGRPEMVSHTKGCYLGQETLARIHARGHVNRILTGLRVDGDRVPEPGTLVLDGDSPVGETRSAGFCPSLDGVGALARIRVQASEPGTTVHLRLDGGLVAARVAALPLYRPPGPREQAETFYRQGMEAFTRDRYEEALGRFERAALMDPGRMDVFESIGVCYERLGRLEEAEETMRSLTEMDPENVMAWTNLSRYLARAGRIEEAEQVKGKVTYLVWKKEAGEKEAARRDEVAAEERQRRLTERMGLFRQVLELDPDDVVANFGLGKILLDLERYREAVPHFERAVAGQKHYSMAFNHLGTCLMRLGRLEEAAAVFREGLPRPPGRGICAQAGHDPEAGGDLGGLAGGRTG